MFPLTLAVFLYSSYDYLYFIDKEILYLPNDIDHYSKWQKQDSNACLSDSNNHAKSIP